ncbi:MAG: DUF1929 domain-containing protein [Chloroflexi bacterium]|nr:DUF1929 domain-containing protein [Chloroflexota bacterium]
MHDQDPAKIGRVDEIRFRCHHLPVHVALLHTGKVLLFGGSCNDPKNLSKPAPAELWNPKTGEMQLVEQELGGDIFCAGHTFLVDGRLLVAGGTNGYDNKIFGIIPFPPFSGLEQSYLFDPVTERWTRVEDMSCGRWYPSLILLGDGRVIAVAGLTKGFPWAFLRTVEIYSPGQGWRKLHGADRWMPLYPRLHLLPDGDIFYAGSFNTHYTFPFVIQGFPTATLNVSTGTWSVIGLPNTSKREEGSTVLLPLRPPDYRARVLLIGGGTPMGKVAVADVEMIDLSDPDGRVWKPVCSMHHARYYSYPVILPDKRVFVMGGKGGDPRHHVAGLGVEAPGEDIPQDPQAIRQTEIYDETTDEWTFGPSLQVDRLYHSSALLLPDGRVLMAGSNPVRGQNELRLELYEPSYFFNGPRPEIVRVPPVVSRGEEFQVETAHSEEIDTVSLMRPMSTTHCFSTDQRCVDLEIMSRANGQLTVKAPPNPNLVPPGYYMLFILSRGIPSEAQFLRVN